MGRKLNLGHLSEEECEQILKVIQKDFDLRQLEKDRLTCIQAKVQEEDTRMKLLASRQEFNEKYCLICFKKFFFIFVTKTQCSFCKHYLCGNCISFESQLQTNICLVCQKYHKFLLQSNSWFYKKLGEKFKRFGSAKVVRSLYKRKTDSDAESDSGYHPSVRHNVFLSESMVKRSRPNLGKVFELDEKNISAETGEDDPVRTLSYYKQKLEAVERQVRKIFIECKGCRQSSKISNYDHLMKQQEFNISLLLSSMTNDLTSSLNEASDLDTISHFQKADVEEYSTKDTISKYVLEQSINHIYTSSASSDDDHPFGVDPEDLTLRSYIEQLSAAFIAKMNADLHSSEDTVFKEEEEQVKKELLKMSNRARISQIGKQLSDSEFEDLPVTNDSMSDVDGREWHSRVSVDAMQTNSLLKTRSANQEDFDESEYDVDENSIFAFASRKKGLISLPVLDGSSPKKGADIDLEFTAHGSSLSEGPWTLLSERGPAAVMSNRIPIAPYDNYGEKKCGPVEAEGDLKMFLPKRHSIDGPLIDGLNVYELPDFSDADLGSPFEKDSFRHDVSLVENITPGEVGQTKTLKECSEAQADRQMAEPRFAEVPQDVEVNSGEAITCSCRLEAAKQVDVFWYRDTDDLIELGSDERFKLTHQGSFHTITLSNCHKSDAGFYLCIAVNQDGSCQHRFAVTVRDKNEVRKSLLDSQRNENISLQSTPKRDTESSIVQMNFSSQSAVTKENEISDSKVTRSLASLEKNEIDEQNVMTSSASKKKKVPTATLR